MCQLFTQHASTYLFHFKYLQNQKKKKIIVDMARKSTTSCGALPLSVMCDPTASIFDLNLYLGFWLITVLSGKHIHSRPSSRVTSLRPFHIFSYSHPLLPLGRGLGGWKWQGGDWEVTRSILLDPIICICPFSDTMTGTGPILKWVGGCLEGGELWQENISSLWHWNRLLVETNRYVIPQGQSEQSTCL